MNFVVQLSAAGTATVALPAAIGNLSRAPSLTCYLAQDISTATVAWLSVADGFNSTTSPSCGLVFRDGAWSAVMIRGIANWYAAFVVVY
ncbi:hypothetical protein [Gemmatimonas sp.]|uniref:hypothetical protein n=1 Tax=Gemmatimonas sp. TaxID=1962908 RepID=UPI0025BD9350|nr:hypothetical protein [Gemmatimonas sp.]MCA2992048.1 hypothetical protein [Gemmatimonas sp.]